MRVEDFKRLISQMKYGSVPFRMVFIWKGAINDLENILKGIEIHQKDLADPILADVSRTKEPQKYLDDLIKRICEKYEGLRDEPSALVLQNAILLVRYGCDLSAIYRHGISPRSAVIFLMPRESNRHLPPRADGWVRRNTKEIFVRMAKQLSTSNCMIEV